jgi:hypothetical protein
MSKHDEPEANRLTGSLRDRMIASRHDFTLDVFVQEGEFWNAIDQFRSRWAVVPRHGIPEFSEAYVCPDSVIAFYVPTEWPAALTPSPLPDSWPSFWELVNVLPPDVMRIDPASLSGTPHPAIEWYLDLKRLHDHFVPELARLPPMPNREAAWTVFLSACVLYTPPADRLLDFAEHSFPEFIVTATRAGAAPTKESLVLGSPWQFGSPVVYLDDIQDVKAAIEARHAETW